MYSGGSGVGTNILAKGNDHHSAVLAFLVIFARQEHCILQCRRQLCKESARLFAGQTDPNKGAKRRENCRGRVRESKGEKRFSMTI